MSLVSIQNLIVNFAGSQESSQRPDIAMSNPEFIRGYEVSMHSREHREGTLADTDIIGLMRDLINESKEDTQEPGTLEFYAGSICGLIVAKCI